MLDSITNGTIAYPNGRGENNFALYTCSFGYTLRGDSRRYCTSQHQWNGTAPNCIAVGKNVYRVFPNFRLSLSKIITPIIAILYILTSLMW